jgi:hypothetical protein
MSKKDENRFVVRLGESLGLTFSAKILVDKRTGVQYLFVAEGYGAGLTPLLGLDGKPLLLGLSDLEEAK